MQAHEVGKYLIIKDGHGRIQQISDRLNSFSVGDRVVSNGRNVVIPDGTRGVITTLVCPYTDGRTSNIIRVNFKDGIGPYWMKFEEIRTLPDKNKPLS